MKECAALHTKLAPEIISIIESSAKTGEPVVRLLEYEYPHCGFEDIKDEFLCGSDILVCPVVTKGTFEKELVFPAGKWQDSDGNVFSEGRHLVKTPIDKLAYFRKIQ